MGSKPKGSERRKYPRIESESKIRYKDFYNPIKVYRNVTCINIGIGGCRFETFEKLQKDQVLTLFINIPLPFSYQFVAAKIFGKVLRAKQTESKNYLTSVYFIAIDRKGAMALKHWLDRELRTKQKRSRNRSRKRNLKTAAVA